MTSLYDVIIIGTGPAGIFAALELSKNSHLRVLMVEKGSDITSRACPMLSSSIPCVQCGLCSILCGWGGAGAYSDGKLTLTPDFGGRLKEYLSSDVLAAYIDEADAVYQSFGAGGAIHGQDEAALARLGKKAAGYGLELIPARIRHIGTDLCKEVLRKIREHLNGKVDVLFDTAVQQILTQHGAVSGVQTRDGVRYEGRHVIVAAGREGSTWLSAEAKRLAERSKALSRHFCSGSST